MRLLAVWENDAVETLAEDVEEGGKGGSDLDDAGGWQCCCVRRVGDSSF